MKTVQLESFNIIGIKVRTTNENGQGAIDIPKLWNKFMTENISAKIPNKIDHSILCIYTNYEKDQTKPYDTILGCKVSSLDEIPEGMIGQEFNKANYAAFTTKGNLNEGIVYNAWLNIWKQDINRTFVADFEVYDERAQNPKDATIDIFVGVQ
jgi:predicted transcriptional regulator YdeE